MRQDMTDWGKTTEHQLIIKCWRCGKMITVQIPRREGDKSWKSYHFTSAIFKLDWHMALRIDGRRVRCPHCEAYSQIIARPEDPRYADVGIMPMPDDGFPAETGGT